MKKNNINPVTEFEPLVVQKNDTSLFAKIGMVPLTIATTVALAIGIGFFGSYSNKSNENRQKSAYLAELSQLSEKIEKSSLLALTADSNAFNELDSSQARVEVLLRVLGNGGQIDRNSAKLSPLDGEAKKTFNQITTDWEQNKALIETLLKRKESLPALKEKVNVVTKDSEKLFSSVVSLQKSLQKSSDNVNPMLVQETTVLTERIINGLNKIFAGGGVTLTDGYNLVKDLRTFDDVQNNLLNGSTVFSSNKLTGDSEEKLQEVIKNFAPFKNITADVLAQMTTLNDSKEVAAIMASASQNISKASNDLSMSVAKDLNSNELLKWISFFFGILTILLIVLLFIKIFTKSKQLESLASVLNKNQNNENAVNVILQQMVPLENGDLTHRIEVDDKFLAKVASGMEGARVSLSTVVGEIKKASQKVLTIAQTNNNVADNLNKDANSQITKLSQTVDKVNEITNALDEVAQAAWSAKENSSLSKEASEKGGQLVDATVKRMDIIRNNIQESSKKIKKLGESAQTISTVIDLIREITKKINILSLNAAIQAASTKSSSREFTILAQEVQTLAKDSEEATSKIEKLVQDIQSDTAEAIAAMERTTQEIVEGAKLSQEAGEALKEIGQLAQDVAVEIEEASTRLEEKSSEMALVALSMDELKKIAQKTVDSTNESTESAADLQSIANTFEKSVAKYKVD